MRINLDFVLKTLQTCDNFCYKTVQILERCPVLSAGAALITAIFIKVIGSLLDKFFQNTCPSLAFYQLTITYSYLQSHSWKDLFFIALPCKNENVKQFDLKTASKQYSYQTPQTPQPILIEPCENRIINENVIESPNESEPLTTLQTDKMHPHVFISLLYDELSFSFRNKFYRNLYLYTRCDADKLNDLNIKKEDAQQTISFVIRNLDQVWEKIHNDDNRFYILENLYENCLFSEGKKKDFKPLEFLFQYLDDPTTVYPEEKLPNKKTSSSLQHGKEILRYLLNVKAPLKRIKTYFTEKQLKEPCRAVEYFIFVKQNKSSLKSSARSLLKYCLLLNKSKEELQEFIQELFEVVLLYNKKNSASYSIKLPCQKIIKYLLTTYKNKLEPIFDALNEIYQKKDPHIMPIFEALDQCTLLFIIEKLDANTLLNTAWGQEILRNRKVWLDLSPTFLEKLYKEGAQPFFLEHIDKSENSKSLVRLMKNFPSIAFEETDILSKAFQKVEWFPFLCKLLNALSTQNAPISTIFSSLYQHQEKLKIQDLWQGNFKKLVVMLSSFKHLVKQDVKYLYAFLNALPLEIRFNIHFMDGFISSDFPYKPSLFLHFNKNTIDEKNFDEKCLESIDAYIGTYIKDVPQQKGINFLEWLAEFNFTNLNDQICEILQRHPHLLPSAIDHYFNCIYWQGISKKFHDLSLAAWNHSPSCGTSFWLSSLKKYSCKEDCWTNINGMIENSDENSPMKLFWKDGERSLHFLHILSIEQLKFLPTSITGNFELLNKRFVERKNDRKILEIFNLIDIKTIPSNKYESYFSLVNYFMTWENSCVLKIKAPLPESRPENNFNQIENFWLNRAKEDPLFYYALPKWAQKDEEIMTPLAEKYPWIPGYMYAISKDKEFDKIIEKLSKKSIHVYFWTLFSCLSRKRHNNFFKPILFMQIYLNWLFKREISSTISELNDQKYFETLCLDPHNLRKNAKKLVEDFIKDTKTPIVKSLEHPVEKNNSMLDKEFIIQLEAFLKHNSPPTYKELFDWFPTDFIDPISVITPIQENWSNPENQLSIAPVLPWSLRTKKTMLVMLMCLKANKINFNVTPLKRRLWALIAYKDAYDTNRYQQMLMVLLCLKELNIKFNVIPLKQHIYRLI